MLPTLPALVLDAASPVSFVQLWLDETARQPEAWHLEGHAGSGIFEGVESELKRTGLTIADFRSFVFCEGPGSMLGIRTVAIAIRSWSAIRGGCAPEIHAYRSFELVAADLLTDGQPPAFSIISDARRDSWHILTVDVDRSSGSIRRVAGDEAFSHADVVFHPKPFPVWQNLPQTVHETPYRPERLRELAKARPSLLRRVSQPEAFVTDAPVYRKWMHPPLASSASKQS